MRQAQSGQRATFRARLLLGVAGAAASVSGAALADTTPAPPPADSDKWLPYSDIGGGFGSGMTAGRVDIFAPVWQDLDSLVFANMGIGTSTRVDTLYNLGVGFRTKLDSEWILGVYGNYDQAQLQDNNSFDQANFGAELMSADWDVRLNGYLADSARKAKTGAYELYVSGNRIAVLQGEDVAYSGFDGEVGYRVFSTDSTDVRVFVGGFHLSHQNADSESLGQVFDFSYHDMTGPMARAEATVYDLDFLGSQSRLTLNAEVSHDDVRKTTGFFGATLRIPLGDFTGGGGSQALDELDRRMIDPERRVNTPTTNWQYSKPEPVVIYGPHMTSQPTNTLLYVDNTLGAGSYANPTTLADATSRKTTNAFIVITSKQGTVVGDGVMQDGQTIVGGGETFTVEGTDSHAKFSHDFAPGTTNPTVSPAHKYDDVITLASTTNLYGFKIAGQFGDAVYGHNVDDVHIEKLTIDGTGGGEDGIYIYRDKSGTESIDIGYTAVSHVLGDGIRIESEIGDGGTTVENITLHNLSVSDVTYGNGVVVGDYAYKGSKIADTISLSNISVHNVGDTGIAVFGGAYGTGSTLNQTATVSGATVTYAGYTGISVYGRAEGGAHVRQTATISNSTVGNVGYNADYGSGIYVGAHAGGVGSVMTQTATLTDDTVSDVYGNFVGYGINIKAVATSGGATVQSVTIDPTTSTGSGIGLNVYAGAYDNGYGPTTVDQTVSVTGGSFDHNYNTGISIDVRSSTDTPSSTNSQAAIYQGVTLTGLDASHNGDGIDIYANARYGASATQSVVASGLTIEHNAYDGVFIGARASGLGFVGQSVEFNGSKTSYNTIAYNGLGKFGKGERDGIYDRTGAYSGGQILQHLYVYYTHIANNGGDGVRIANYAGGYLARNKTYYYSHLQQNLIFAYMNSSFNRGNGVSLYNRAYYGAQIDQFVDFYHASLNDNRLDGFYEKSVAVTYKPGSGYDLTIPTNIHSNVYAYNSTFSYNQKNGIEIVSDLSSPMYKAGLVGYSYLQQHITVSGSQVYGNAKNGFANAATETGVYGLNAQYVTLEDSSFNYNGGDGAHFYAHQNFGPGSFGAVIQDPTILHSVFYGNSGNGLYAFAKAEGYQGRAEQHFTIQYTYFGGNSGAGIYLHHVAQNGVYTAAHPCFVVQGLAGGCAFVRSTFDMLGDTVAYNGGDGIRIVNYANNYGAIYAVSGRTKYTANMVLDKVYVGRNNGAGLSSTTRVNNESFAYNYIVALDSTLSYNRGSGFQTFAGAYGNSAIVEKNVLYTIASPVQVGHNGGMGVDIADVAEGGSYVGGLNLLSGKSTGVNASNNGGFGIRVQVSYADASSLAHQRSYIYGSTFNSNGDGVGLYSVGPGADQKSYLGGNTVKSNPFVGVYGEANFGAYQYVKVHTGGNTVTSNGTNYLFNAFGGATQNVN